MSDILLANYFSCESPTDKYAMDANSDSLKKPVIQQNERFLLVKPVKSSHKPEPGGDVDREEFYQKINELLTSKQAPNTFLLTREKYERLIEQVKHAKTTPTKTPTDFRRAKRYDVFDTPIGERLFLQPQHGKNERLMYVAIDEMYDIIRRYHLELNHAGRSRLMVILKKKYKNITTQCVMIYLSLCKGCISNNGRRMVFRNKKSETRKDEPGCSVIDDYAMANDITADMASPDPLVEGQEEEAEIEIELKASCRPKIHPELYSRGQVDILEVTSVVTEEFKYLMVYRDLVTKFTHLKALKATTKDDTAEALLEVFLVFGAPNILQSKNGISVTKPICRRISSLCKHIKIVAGDVNISERDFIGKSNEDILRMLNEWMTENRSSKWHHGVKYVQYVLNTTFHVKMCKSPSELVFGVNPRNGLASVMDSDDYDGLNTENDLKESLEQRDAPSQQTKLEASLIMPCNIIKQEPQRMEDFDDDW